MKTLFCITVLAILCSNLAFGETEKTRYYRQECEKIQEPQICGAYDFVKENEKKSDNERSRILSLDAPYSVLIDAKDNLTGRLVSARRRYTPEEKKKYIGIEDKEYKYTSELQLSEKLETYRFDVSGTPKDKTNNSVRVLFSNKDYIYFYFITENTPNKYDQSDAHYTYLAFDRKYKTLIELFYFRGNSPYQGGVAGGAILKKIGNDYSFKWSGILDGDRVNIYYIFSVLPNEKMDCKKSWDDCEGINIIPKKQ